MKKQNSDAGIKVKGMFRIHLTENGKVVGNSGWQKNTITANGFNQYLVFALASSAGSKYVSHIALAGTSAIASTFTATSMTGELSKRTTVTAATSSTSKTARFTGSFASSASFNTSAGVTIGSVGLWNTSSGGTMFAGNTFTSSTLGTNQSVVFTYDIIFN